MSNLSSGLRNFELVHLIIYEASRYPTLAVDILTQCTNITLCNMLFKHWEYDDPLPLVSLPVLFPNLTVLVLKFSGFYYGGRISPAFDVITPPAVQHLKVVAPYAFDAKFMSSLVAMQKRSRASITRLTLADVVFSHLEAFTLLRILPSLKYLTMRAPLDGKCRGYIFVLSHIAYQLSSDDPPVSVILPNLTEITITDNLPDVLLNSKGRLRQRYVNKDLSALLMDELALTALATRWWANEDEPLEAPGGRLQRLERATMQWRNVPRELCEKERTRVSLVDTMGILVNFPLEPRLDGR